MNKPLDLKGKWLCVHDVAAGRFSLTRSALCVVIRLLQHQNVKSGQCNPSYSSLADYTGLSEKSVQNAIKELERKGVIAVHRNGRGKRNSYRFIDPPGSILPGKPKAGKRASETEEGGFPKEKKSPSSEKKKEKNKKKEPGARVKGQPIHRRTSAKHADKRAVGEKRLPNCLKTLENLVALRLENAGLPRDLLVHVPTQTSMTVYDAYESYEISIDEARDSLLTACREVFQNGAGDL